MARSRTRRPSWSRNAESESWPGLRSALLDGQPFACRAAWRDRARPTRRRISAVDSPGLEDVSASPETAPTVTMRSNRSRSGPERRSRYLSIWWGVQRHSFEGSPANPQGQGFMAPTSRKRAGKTATPAARAIRTTPSSTGWRSTSRARRPNSGISSRKRTPLWARLTSPGRGSAPPPTRATADVV